MGVILFREGDELDELNRISPLQVVGPASSGMPRADMMMVHLRCKDITNLGEIGRGRGE